MDVHTALRNVLLVLQADPTRYRCFGVYWWPVKKLLRGAGYGRDQFYMLSDYQDTDQANQVPVAGLADTLREAFAAYALNLAYPHSGGKVEASDGELITVWDEDAGT